MPESEDTSEMFCRGCSYNLHGLTSHRCPECGRSFNPNDASTFDWTAHPPKRWPARLGTVLAIYPIILVLSIYIAWIAGRLELGHWPRPMIDDPKYIGGSMDSIFPIVSILLGFLSLLFSFSELLVGRLGFPPLAVVPLVIVAGYLGVQLVYWEKPPRRFWLLLVMICVTWIGGLLILWRDPLRVLAWFMD